MLHKEALSNEPLDFQQVQNTPSFFNIIHHVASTNLEA